MELTTNMTRTLYLQCDSGVSGDMFVGALLDLGASEDGLREALRSLGVEGYKVRISRKNAGPMEGCDFDVVVDADHENHDHDMAWLFGSDAGETHNHGHHHGHHHGHGHGRGHHHAHAHDHGHEHGHEHVHEHGHEHRQLSDIRTIVEESGLSSAVQKTAMRIFQIIAEAEAKAHGASVEEVHFHEVGAIDSIVDVVAAAWCLDDLGVEQVVTSALAEGEGHVRSAHGVLSIPVPAVANIAEAYGLVLTRAHRHAELVTPTGAAIIAATRNADELPQTYRIVATGLGTGKRAYDPPSTLRALLVEDVEVQQGHQEVPCDDVIWKLETEVDDCTGEALGYVMDRLYAAGAREAHFLPVFMKKGRPGYQLEILCDEDSIPILEDIVFQDTTTIGIRRCPVERTTLERSFDQVSVANDTVRVKCVTLPSGAVRYYPEHDDVAALAQRQGIAYQEMMRMILAAM